MALCSSLPSCADKARLPFSSIHRPRLTVQAKAAPGSAELTRGQILRGHGADGLQGWKEAGWDGKTLKPELGQLLVHDGELAQATYDNLGLDRNNADTWGRPKVPDDRDLSTQPAKVPHTDDTDLLTRLDSNYALEPDAPAPNGHVGTADKYQLAIDPSNKLSPIINARPGCVDDPGDQPDQRTWSKEFSEKFSTAAKLLVTLVDGNNGSRPLFLPEPETGRGMKPRGVFMGYIAVSKPGDSSEGANNEVDVAVVWRGTIFKEEWESNFAQDKLDDWFEGPEEKIEHLKPGSTNRSPSGILVHDGFDDLYNRTIEQPGAAKGNKCSPRQVVREWLMVLMKEHNVATITVTGHSLGGGIATICAFGAASWLTDDNFKKICKDDWKTQTPPKVTAITFGAPRAGDYKFKQEFYKRGARALHVVNKDDLVPKVPGVLVTGAAILLQEAPPLLQKVPVLGPFFGLLQITVLPLLQKVLPLLQKLPSLLQKVPVLGPILGLLQRVQPAAEDHDDRQSRNGTTAQAAVWVATMVGGVEGLLGFVVTTPVLGPVAAAKVGIVMGVVVFLFVIHKAVGLEQFAGNHFDYYHVGQVLKLDSTSSSSSGLLAKDLGKLQQHNLELHLALLSKLFNMQRNPLLLNKSADLLADKENNPADWWREPGHRGCKLGPDGRWHKPPLKQAQPSS